MQALQDAIIRLLKKRPFYGQFLLQFRRRVQSAEKAAGVTIADGIPTLIIDPQTFALFSGCEQEALLEHLIKHILHLHPCRRRERNPRYWDLACDLAINPGIDNLPRESSRPERLRLPDNLAAEDYYSRLQQLPNLGNVRGAGNGDNQGAEGEREKADAQQQRTDQSLPEPLDDHSYWQEADRTPASLSEQVVRQMVQTACRKSHGEVPADLQQLVAGFLAPPSIPWQQLLRQFVGSAGRIGRTGTWKRGHRRFGHDTPGLRKQQLLNLLVAVDVSDSTDSQPLRESFARELLQIARGRKSRISLIYSGSRIQKIEQFCGTPQVCEVYRGGGFTDLRPVFEYARQMQPRPAAIIYLTDGYGPAPEQSAIPTLWVLTPDGRKPVDWGLELRLDRIEENTHVH